jgi:16S rRNA (guanine527-N7)-methyltransferase
LIAAPFIPKGASVCDLGSGGGLPGIPIKILRDDIKLFLVESVQKKANFLKIVVQELRLDRTHILAQRAETIELKFDIILIRLLGRLKKVLKLVAPILKDGGEAIIYKSEQVEEELRAAKPLMEQLGVQIKDVKTIPLPSLPIQRRLLIVAKLLQNSTDKF